MYKNFFILRTGKFYFRENKKSFFRENMKKILGVDFFIFWA